MWLSRVGRGPERLRLARNSSFAEVIKGLVEGAAVVYPSDWVVRSGVAPNCWRGAARAVVTMGTPAVVYRWYCGAHGLKSLTQNLALVGIKPRRSVLVGRLAEPPAHWALCGPSVSQPR